MIELRKGRMHKLRRVFLRVTNTRNAVRKSNAQKPELILPFVPH